MNQSVSIDQVQTGGRIAGLDGLRAVAVMLVFCAHYSAYLLPRHADILEKIFPGMLGVALFFALSGFLISNLLTREFGASANIRLKNFYARRLLRLSPALYVYVAVTATAYLAVDHRLRWGDIFAAFFYISNYYNIAFHTPLYYMPVWSLAIEEHFYLLFPLFLLVVLTRASRAFTPILLGLLVIQYIWRFHVASTPHMDWHWIYWRTDTRLDSLLFGVLLTALAGAPSWRPLHRLVTSSPAMVVALLLMAVSVLDRNDLFRMSLRYTLQGAALAVSIGYIVYNSGRIATTCRRLLDTAPLVYISRISYSLYLWHLTIIKFAEHALGHVAPLLAIGLGILSFGVASASYRFIETPFLNLRHRFGSHAPA